MFFTDGTDQSQLLKHTIFFCVHCLESKAVLKSFSGTIDDVSAHWLIEHLDESNSKPFQFYAVALVGCFYCDEVGIYHDLLKHHQEKHPNTVFVVVDQKNPMKCGMCNFKDGNLAEHFTQQHHPSSVPKVFNPIYYSEERVAALLAANTTKKYQCEECNGKFETYDEIGEHFSNAHNGQTIRSKEVIDYRTTPDHVICGYCHKKYDHHRYLAHLSEHDFSFRCTACSYQSGDLSDIARHEKLKHNIDSLEYHCSIFPHWIKKKLSNTNLVFDNGLVLKSYNLLETKYDDSKLLDMHIHSYLDMKKQRAKEMIEMHGTHANETFSADGWNQTSKPANRNDVPRNDNPMEIPKCSVSPAGSASNVLNEEVNRLKSLVEELLQKTSNEPAMNPFQRNSNLAATNQNNPVRTIDEQARRVWIEQEEAANQLNRSAVQSETKVATNGLSLTEELFDQQKLAKNVYVQGICSGDVGTDRYDVFIKLCKKMGVTIFHSSIQRIDQCPKGIVVK